MRQKAEFMARPVLSTAFRGLSRVMALTLFGMKVRLLEMSKTASRYFSWEAAEIGPDWLSLTWLKVALIL
ncbi:hypothetical protein WDZ92_50825 [Nostoc sp. NIES-2111]